MKIRTLALTGAALLAIAATPSFAHTSQPATPEEMQQTDALNAQALAAARGGQAMDRSMANTDVNARMQNDTTAPNASMSNGAAMSNDTTDGGANSSTMSTGSGVSTGSSVSSGSMTAPTQPTPTLPAPQPNTTPPKNESTTNQ